MKKLIKIIISFIIMLSNFNCINFAKNNNINQIDININILENGSAKITEIWKVDMYSRNRTISFV